MARSEARASLAKPDWDAWRAAYPTLTFQQQQDFHSVIYREHPEQRHFDADLVARAIDETRPAIVVELGGWDGELAGLMLDRYPSIDRWTNWEICREAAEAGVARARSRRYTAPPMSDWYWARQHRCDLFVASHTIEHLSVEHLNLTLAATDARVLFFDAPLKNKPKSWRRTTTTHMLETGWDGVTDLCRGHGYRLLWAEDHDTAPESGDRARACLYGKD